MSKRRRFTLNAKLLILVLSIVIISNLFVGLNSLGNSTPALTGLADHYLNSVTDDVTHRIANINEKEYSLIRSLAQMDLMKDERYTLQEKQAQLTSILKSLGSAYQNLAFYDKNGNAIRDTGELINLADREYFKTAISGKEVLTDPAYSPVADAVLTYYGTPVYGYDKQVVGAIILLIKGNAIQKLIEQIDLGAGNHPSVINRNTGNIIAEINNEDQRDKTSITSPEINAIMTKLKKGERDIAIFTDPETKVKMIASYAPIENTTWSAFVAAPYNLYMGSIKKLENSNGLSLLLAIIASILLSIFFIRYLTKPLLGLNSTILEIASGNADLTKRIPEASNDEIGDVINSFNQFMEKLQQIVSNIKNSKDELNLSDEDLQASTQDTSAAITEMTASIDSVNAQMQTQSVSVSETASAVNEISANITSLENMIDHQSQDVSTASTAVEQMIGNINSVTTAVAKMVASFEMLEQNTNAGINSLSATSEKINQINEESRMLQDANTAIANIAGQTNLLAMNAAIEAAHAGEAGKGFAVVADEIRKLSETSSAQSKSVSSELNKIQDTISQVVQTTLITNEAFSSVSKNIVETSQIIHQIKGAMEEQQTGSKQIVDTLHSMNDSTVEVKSASREMTEGNRQILDLIKKLQDVTEKISRTMEEMQSGVTKINSTGTALTQISGKVEESINKIGNEVNLFEV